MTLEEVIRASAESDPGANQTAERWWWSFCPWFGGDDGEMAPVGMDGLRSHNVVGDQYDGMFEELQQW